MIKKSLILMMTVILGVLFIFFIPALNIYATEDLFLFPISQIDVVAKDEVRVSVVANGNITVNDVAGFRLTTEYDQTKLTLKRVDYSSQIENGTFRYHIGTDKMTGVYVCNGKKPPQLQGTCLTLVFTVNNDALLGDSSVSVGVDQVVDWSGKDLDAVSEQNYVLKVDPVYEREAYLTSLVPSRGKLAPGFKSDALKYSVDVDSSVDQISFNTTAIDEGVVTVSRKNLEKVGTSTPITITVKSADGKNKTQYLVTVNRGAKNASVSSVKSTAKGKTSGSTKSTANTDVGANNSANGITFYGDRNLYLVGNQMPAFLIYMLVGGLGVIFFAIIAIFIIRYKRKGAGKHRKK